MVSVRSKSDSSSSSTCSKKSSTAKTDSSRSSKSTRREENMRELRGNSNQSVPPAINRSLPAAHFLPAYLAPYVKHWHGDFFHSIYFHSRLIAQLMAEGFLPMACSSGRVLLPKLHSERCVIEDLPRNLHVSKSVRKRASRYVLQVQQDLNGVIEGCNIQHAPNCWLYGSLVKCLTSMHQATRDSFALDNIEISSDVQAKVCSATQQENANGALQNTNSSASNDNFTTIPIRVYSIQLYRIEEPEKSENDSHNDEETTQRNKHLVAGELGYTVGSIYTSLTGFTNENGAGSVQLAALGRLLCQCGFTMWDLGMDMPYKRDQLGADLMHRHEFVNYVHQHRECQVASLPCNNKEYNARYIIDHWNDP